MERARKRGPRCRLLTLCLGIALMAALLARLLAHKPRCPEAFRRTLRKQRPSFRMPECKWQELRVSSAVQSSVDVKLSL